MALKIALAQIHIHFGKPDENLSTGLSMIENAAQEGCNLILFPELWTTGYDLKNIRSYVKTNEEIIPVLQQACLAKQIAIGGSFITRSGEDFRNSFILIDSSGNRLPQYDKLHLIKLFDEEKYFKPGNNMQVSLFDWGKAGLSICYDLRFPEIFRVMALQQVEIFLLVAEWPISRIEHWKTLIRARAIENQVFFAAVNCVGTSGKETFGGFSSCISPWGDVLSSGNSASEQLIIQEITLSDIWKYRKFLDSLQDRRPDLY